MANASDGSAHACEMISGGGGGGGDYGAAAASACECAVMTLESVRFGRDAAAEMVLCRRGGEEKVPVRYAWGGGRQNFVYVLGRRRPLPPRIGGAKRGGRVASFS